MLRALRFASFIDDMFVTAIILLNFDFLFFKMAIIYSSPDRMVS